MSVIDSYVNRPKAYYNIDGVGELGMGFMFFGFTLLEWLQVSTPKDAVWHHFYGLILYMSLLSLFLHYGSKAIKKHLTYPRTGYVEYRRDVRMWGALVIATVVAAVLSVGLAVGYRAHWNLTTPSALFGVVLAGFYYGKVARAVRWKWVAALVMAAGSITIALLPPAVTSAVVGHSPLSSRIPAELAGVYLLSFALYGGIFVVSGGITLYLFSRRTKRPVEEAE